ncbi:hypothetical protein HPIN_01440 [Helicobacter pylori India7]|uniref:Uncharacterized protein n=1 Tax=Helicobacter pylori (strain India7) TaxID=907238 RepID=E8QEN8_HELP7|nr:hypothetical protein HPIN_01440 [Helicobacter pylori India7]
MLVLGIFIHSLEYICIGMYLERYSAKAFFVILEKFCHFLLLVFLVSC